VGRPASHGVPRAPCYSGTPLKGGRSISHKGLSPALVRLSRRFCYRRLCNPSRRPQPRAEARFGLSPLSLAATHGIHVCLFSCGYLDVSVPRVRSMPPIHSAAGDLQLNRPGFPIRTSPDQCSFASSPELFAGYHVLHRLSMPRHPPYTLMSLITSIDHRFADMTHAMTTPRKCHQGMMNSRPTDHFRQKRCSTISSPQRGWIPRCFHSQHKNENLEPLFTCQRAARSCGPKPALSGTRRTRVNQPYPYAGRLIRVRHSLVKRVSVLSSA
jgi:hypothetical protein